MLITFYVAACVAIVATVLAVTRLNAIHGLLYFIVSLFSVALIFLALGATFVAALEVIIYAGAIMVLFVFVVMMLNLGPEATRDERHLLAPEMWWGPGILSLLLGLELAYVVTGARTVGVGARAVGPKAVGVALFGPYLLGVEIASMLLLAGLVGAYHLGHRTLRGRS